MATTLFDRLAAGRPPQEPTPAPTPEPTPPEALRLLHWLQHNWGRPVVCARDIHRGGPTPIRDRESALEAAEILEKRGWLIPLKAHRYDRKKWQITIGPV